MTSRSFALSSLVAAIPGAVVAVLIVMAILDHSGEIFASIPLAATLILALICGVIVAVAPVVLFARGRKDPAARRVGPAGAAAAPAGGSSGEVFAGGSSDEIAAVGGSSAEVVAAGGTSDEILAADSAEFAEADSAELEPVDDDPFADFDADDEEEADDFFDSPSNK